MAANTEPAKKVAESFAGGVAGELKTVKVGNVEVVLCWCPAGRFTMGSPPGEKDRLDDREAQVEVTLTTGFWMTRTEMTQELYDTFMDENPSNFKSPNLPVETVRHAEAVACAAKLTQNLREAHLLPDGWEIRLPTEA